MSEITTKEGYEATKHILSLAEHAVDALLHDESLSAEEIAAFSPAYENQVKKLKSEIAEYEAQGGGKE